MKYKKTLGTVMSLITAPFLYFAQPANAETFSQRVAREQREFTEQTLKQQKEFQEQVKKEQKEFDEYIRQSNIQFRQELEKTRIQFNQRVNNFHNNSQDEISDLEERIAPVKRHWNIVPRKRIMPRNRITRRRKRETQDSHKLRQEFNKFKKSLDTIVDNDVRPLFSNEEAYQFFRLSKVDGREDKVEFAKNLHNKYSQIWPAAEHKGFPLFKAKEIINIYNLDNDFTQRVDELLKHKPEQNHGNPFFHDGEQILRAYLNKMPEKFINGWGKLLDRLNFDCEFLNKAWVSQLYADSDFVTKALALETEKGDKLYDKYDKDAKSLLELHQLGATAETLEFFSQFRNKNDYFSFRPEHLTEIMKKGFDLNNEYIQQLLELEKRNKGKLTFRDLEDATDIKNMNNPNYVSSLYKIFKEIGIDYELSLSKIKRYCQLNLPLREIFFYDTRKPNALIVLPTADHNDAFYGESGRNFIKTILRQYDSQILIADTEKDVYAGLKFVPNISLASISGHGTKTTLSLGEADLRLYTGSGDETKTIDISDTEFVELLKETNPYCVLFLWACSNGQGREYENNLANFSAKSGRKVISGDNVSNITEITSSYPFDAEVYYHDKNTNQYTKVTYKIHIGGMAQ